MAWTRGLKTTYYLRTLAATSAEKSTGRGGELNSVPASGGIASGSAASNPRQASGKAAPSTAAAARDEPKFCAIDDPTCEACQ